MVTAILDDRPVLVITAHFGNWEVAGYCTGVVGLRTFAIALGCLNALGGIGAATLVLYGQEVLHTTVLEFGLLSTGTALGGVVGGWSASWVTKRIGTGASVGLTLWVGAVAMVLVGIVSHWVLAALLFVVIMFVAVLWNVITVSLRQTVIPDRLLGRVNSVYRFFAGGMMPIGAAIGGATVAVVDRFASRDLALRSTWFLSAAIHAVLFAFGRARLTTDRIEAARAAGADTG